MREEKQPLPPNQFELTPEQATAVRDSGIEIRAIKKETARGRYERCYQTLRRGSGLVQEDADWIMGLAKIGATVITRGINNGMEGRLEGIEPGRSQLDGSPEARP